MLFIVFSYIYFPIFYPFIYNIFLTSSKPMAYNIVYLNFIYQKNIPTLLPMPSITIHSSTKLNFA